MNNKIKIAFFGTPEFAVPTLKALNKADFCDVLKVITQPDKPIGRHHSKLVASDVKMVAKELNIPVSTKPPPSPLLSKGGGISTESRHPEFISGSVPMFKKQTLTRRIGGQDDKIDLGVLVAYGNIIPKKVIDSFPLGILNIHPSLLPKYRGSSPIQSVILNQDKETGITIMKLDNKMDHGPIVAQAIIKLNQTETTGELHNKLAQIGADLMIKILPDYIAGKIKIKEQDESKASYTKKLRKQDGKIDFNSMAQPSEPLIRAMNPWPGAWTQWKGKKIIIWSIKKDGTPNEVQLEGKKKMPYSEFLKGHPDFKFNGSS